MKNDRPHYQNFPTILCPFVRILTFGITLYTTLGIAASRNKNACAQRTHVDDNNKQYFQLSQQHVQTRAQDKNRNA